MLEKLLKAIKTSEKYSVRVADEVVHKLINKPVRWIEKNKGVPRRKQAAYVGIITPFSAGLIWGAEGFKAFQNDQSVSYAILKNKWDYVILHLFSFYGDIKPLAQKKMSTQQKDGTIAESINSWDSLIRAIRPYALAGSIAGIAYGLSRDSGIAQYSAISLPWVLSMYVRDGNTGGLLEKIGAKLKELLPAKLPAYQPVPVRI